MAAAIPAAISAVGVVGGMLSGNKAAKESAKLQKKALELQERQVKMAEWNLDRYKTEFAPVEDKYVTEATSTKPTSYYGEEKGALDVGYRKAEDKIVGNTSLASGLQSSMLSGVGIEKAKGLASLKIKDDQRKQGMVENAMTLGRGGNAAITTAQSSMNNASSFYSNVSSQLAGEANSSYASAAEGMSSLASMFGDYYKSKQLKAGTTTS